MRQGDHKFMNLILRDVKQDMSDEEIIHALLAHRVSKEDQPETFGARVADRLAGFAGSWLFVGIFSAAIVIWMAVNTWLASFDPFPFILLNLVLSCVAAVQAPLIMMSQNRQEKKDRERAESDYHVNLKTEIIIEDLHNKVDSLMETQQLILEVINRNHGKTG